MTDKTHAPKETTGKPEISLLPMDVLIKHLLPAYEEGLKKYEKESWRKGFPVSQMMDACLRHINCFYWEGGNFDEEALNEYDIIKPHLGAAVFCLLSILHTLDNYPELDDRPCPDTVKRDQKT